MLTLTVREIAQNALKLIEEGRLQAQMWFNHKTSLGSCYYMKRHMGVEYRCVIGASMPHELCKIADAKAHMQTVRHLQGNILDIDDIELAENMQETHDCLANGISEIQEGKKYYHGLSPADTSDFDLYKEWLKYIADGGKHEFFRDYVNRTRGLGAAA